MIQANGANGFAINAATNATVANAGRIEATGAGGIAIQALNGTATVNNIGDGITTGIITADAFAIKGGAVKLTGNTGLIEATGASGNAIFASAPRTSPNGTIWQAGNGGFAIFTNGTATVNNIGMASPRASSRAEMPASSRAAALTLPMPGRYKART